MYGYHYIGKLYIYKIVKFHVYRKGSTSYHLLLQFVSREIKLVFLEEFFRIRINSINKIKMMTIIEITDITCIKKPKIMIQLTSPNGKTNLKTIIEITHIT